MFSKSRTPFSLCSVVLAFSVVVPAAQQAPQFCTGTHNVPVYVTAIDASGHLVTDLTQDEFVLLDNGQPQPISNFANNTQPITVVVMLDRSGSVEEHFPLIEGAAAEFVQHLSLDDAARIGSFAERIQLDPVSFTNDRDMLLRDPENRAPANRTDAPLERDQRGDDGAISAAWQTRGAGVHRRHGCTAQRTARTWRLQRSANALRKRKSWSTALAWFASARPRRRASPATRGRGSFRRSGFRTEPRPLFPAPARRGTADTSAAAGHAGRIALAGRPHADTDALAASARAERPAAGVWSCETNGDHLRRHEARPQPAHTGGRERRRVLRVEQGH